LKNKKFNYILTFLGMLAVMLFFVLKQMNKEHIDVNKSAPNMIIAVDEILSDYQNDEEQANSRFTDKIVQLKGVISKISTQNDYVSVTLMSPNFDATVICSFQSEESLDIIKYKEGDEISLKGICKGYLLDVVLVNCVIIK